MSKTTGNIMWESARGNIFLRLVNQERNEVKLEEKVYIPFLDLAILFYCDLKEYGLGGFYVKKEHLLRWNQDTDSLLRTARENTFHKNNILVGFTTREMLCDGRIMSTNEEDMKKDEPTLMITLSNKDMLYGAAMLTNTDELKKLADRLDSSLYLFPSSVHEIFAVCASFTTDIEFSTNMIKDINDTIIEPEVYLSDNLYYFDREKCEVKIAIPA